MGVAEAHFNQHRDRLFGIAYRMTGMVADAEDLVQDVFIKWMQADSQSIRNPEAWLVRVISHLALDHLKSSAQKRRVYPGPWLPEPLVAEEALPEAQLGMDESLSMALLLVLDRLTPHQRAAFILHEVFQYPHDEIATILGKTSAHCRQLVSRARRQVQIHSEPARASIKAHRRMFPAFIDAIRNGDSQALESLLRQDVAFHSDGGGKAVAARKPIHGTEKVGRFLLRVLSPLWNSENVKRPVFLSVWFNGLPGLLLTVNDRVETAFQFQMDQEKICAIYAVRNPEKLGMFSSKDRSDWN